MYIEIERCMRHIFLTFVTLKWNFHTLILGLYRIYFFPIRPEPDFEIDCNFTNLMCKNITIVRVIWVFLIIFVYQLLLHRLHTLTQ